VLCTYPPAPPLIRGVGVRDTFYSSGAKGCQRHLLFLVLGGYRVDEVRNVMRDVGCGVLVGAVGVPPTTLPHKNLFSKIIYSLMK